MWQIFFEVLDRLAILATFTVSVVGVWNNRSNWHKARAAIVENTNITETGAVQCAHNGEALKEIQIDINGRISQLLETTKSDSSQQCATDEHDRVTAPK